VAAVEITPDDLSPFADIDTEKALAMIDDALAMASLVAPCITDDEFTYTTAAKAIIRGAILRWNDAGSGAITQQGAGPFQMTVDNRQQRKGMFWPSEINQLQDLCRDHIQGQAFTIDTTPAAAGPGYWATPDTWVPLNP
jgi:hypothetical protein